MTTEEEIQMPRNPFDEIPEDVFKQDGSFFDSLPQELKDSYEADPLVQAVELMKEMVKHQVGLKLVLIFKEFVEESNKTLTAMGPDRMEYYSTKMDKQLELMYSAGVSASAMMMSGSSDLKGIVDTLKEKINGSRN